VLLFRSGIQKAIDASSKYDLMVREAEHIAGQLIGIAGQLIGPFLFAGFCWFYNIGSTVE
jgi:hypothetical protein